MFSCAHHYCFYFHYVFFILQPDRGAKRPREEDGGAAGGEEDSRRGKQQKGQSVREAARYQEAGPGGVGFEGGIEMRDTDELTGDKKNILEKLMDQDEEEPEVGKCCTVITIESLHMLTITFFYYSVFNLLCFCLCYYLFNF